MESVALKNDLKFNQDVKKQSIGRAKDYNDYVEKNLNKTLYSIVWCTDYWDVELFGHTAEVPCNYGE